MSHAANLDKKYIWHPFTQMKDWMKQKPIVICEGKGTVLKDDQGNKYLDANSSIWTNLHGHAHPVLNKAIQGQLTRISHSSGLGLANEPSSFLSRKLIRTANPASSARWNNKVRLKKVFYSDDGSTAMEVALKLAYEAARRTRGIRHPGFVSVKGGYHGDTVGAVSVGHIDLFHKSFSGLLFKSKSVMSPYCYRCPHNRAKPERQDARDYRKCNWECLDTVESAFRTRGGNTRSRKPVAMVVEPLMQGAAGMIPQPKGWLSRVAEIVRGQGAFLIADEVMTGFGRTGTLFASHQEKVQPDFMVLAKGLTGGYLPMAATLMTQEVFDAFLGDYGEFKTFFHGHSYFGNQLGSVVADASLDLLSLPDNRRKRKKLEKELRSLLKGLWMLPQVGDIRQVGLIAGIELVKDWKSRLSFPLKNQAGIRVCRKMAEKGVLTRPIGNVVLLMPPYCTTIAQLRKMVRVLKESVTEVFSQT